MLVETLAWSFMVEKARKNIMSLLKKLYTNSLIGNLAYENPSSRENGELMQILRDSTKKMEQTKHRLWRIIWRLKGCTF